MRIVPTWLLPFTFSFLTLFPVIGWGQEQKPSPQSSIELTDYQWNKLRGDTKSHFIRIIQFKQIPAPDLMDEWKRVGIKWLAYLGEGKYQMAFPTDLLLERLADKTVISLDSVEPGFRIEQAIRTGDIPDYAWESDRIKVLLDFFPFATDQEVYQKMEQQGLEVKVIYRDVDRFLIQSRCNPDNWNQLLVLPGLRWAELMPAPPQPESSIGVGQHGGFTSLSTGLPLQGSEIGIAVRETPFVHPHIDLKGRFDNSLAGAGGGTHGNFTSGVAAGAGNLSPKLRGMAPGSDLYALAYRADFLGPTLPLHEGGNILITNSSYGDGCNAGYTLYSEIVDQQMFFNPTLLHIFSAGNSGGTDCRYGAGGLYGNLTGGHKSGKNVIAVGSVNAQDQHSSFSSRGPSQDGRIKPELVALGQSVLLTGTNNDQGSASGTSFSAPAVAGVSAQLYEAYAALHGGQVPEAALIKALLLNGAKDLGRPGPDFQYGWGRLDGKSAFEALEAGYFEKDSLSSGQQNTHTISLPPGATGVKVMLYWADPAAHPMAAQALVNDLDIRIIQGNDTLLPWHPDPSPNLALLQTPAQAGRDSLNNVEQIVLSNPGSGILEIQVLGTEVPFGPQAYWLTYQVCYDSLRWDYPIAGESLMPNEATLLRWRAATDTIPFSLSYRLSPTNSWNLISDSIFTDFYSWLPPDTFTHTLQFQLSRGNQVVISPEEVSLLATPEGLRVEQVCPEGTRIQWQKVKGADFYRIFRLGNRYMDSLSISSDTFFIDSHAALDAEHWYSVRAETQEGALSERAFAVQKIAGRLGCPLEGDAGIQAVSLINPTNGLSCAGDSIELAISIRNEGTQALSDIPFSVTLAQAGIQLLDTLREVVAGNSAFQRRIKIGLAPPFPDSLKILVRVSLAGDAYPPNDSLFISLAYQPSTANQLPIREDFEGWKVCSYFPDCEATSCELEEGWVNAPNGQEDDIDWRVHFGQSLLLGTGPTLDSYPGTEEGHYVYLETGGNCRNREAYLVSPCIDLTASTEPELRFAYHMFGAGIVGFISVDVWSQGRWIRNVVPNLAGNKGDLWLERVVSLADFSGEIIRIRFRGRTGNSTFGQIALDDIRIRERLAPPTPGFTIRPQTGCLGSLVVMQANSIPKADSIRWFSIPSGLNFLPGSSDTSQVALINTTQWGTYGIGLIVIDSLGRDTLFEAEGLRIHPGLTTSWEEDFDSGYFPPANWQFSNPDRDLNWQWREVVSKEGVLTRSAVMHHSLLFAGGLDAMQLPPLDLRSADSPKLIFDVSYARDTARLADDVLRIKVSDDCGSTFPFTPYDKSGATLATFEDIDEFWAPTQSYHWRTDTLDLSSFKGSSILVQFETLFGGSNPIYLDNLKLIDTGEPGPLAQIQLRQTGFCLGDTVEVQAAYMGGLGEQYSWDFGAWATPQTTTGPGPHYPLFSSAGTYDIELEVYVNGDTSRIAHRIELLDSPVADFQAETQDSASAFRFTPSFSSPLTHYFWDFGDGNHSNEKAPLHTYVNPGTYAAQLILSSPCGKDTSIKEISISPSSLNAGAQPGLILSPNPTKEKLWVGWITGKPIKSVKVFTLQGQEVKVKIQKGNSDQLEIDVSALPVGVYILWGSNGETEEQALFIKE